MLLDALLIAITISFGVRAISYIVMSVLILLERRHDR